MINKKIASEIAVGIVLILAIAIGGIFWMQEKKDTIETRKTPEVVNVQKSEVKNEVACTMEAKLCDDGSSVGRSGPNCEFARCPAGK